MKTGLPDMQLREEARKFYQSSEAYCDSLDGESEKFFGRYLGLIGKYGADARTILDAGCGTGFSTRLIGERNKDKRVFGSDLSPLFLKRGTERGPAQNVRFMAGDIFQMPFRDETFDLVSSYLVIEVLPDAERGLEEMCRVLRKGGTLIVCTPNLLSPVWALLDVCKILSGGQGRPVWCENLPAALRTFGRNLGISTRKLFERQPHFRYRKPDLTMKKVVGMGKESFYLACQKDITLFLKQRGFTILRTRPDPSLIERFFPPSFSVAVEVVARKV